MAVGAASVRPLPTTLSQAPRPSASLLSHTLFSRHYPLLFSPIISRRNAQKLNTTSLFIYGRKTTHGFLVSASSRRRRESSSVSAADSVDDNDEWEEAEEEEGEALMPFQEMSRWLRNRPAGFGEGKTYDITIEEKLLEEIERSRKAQLANINKLRSVPNKQQPPQKEIDVVPSGTRVRVTNLPRKKNIHRDLQLAFKGFPGIININPAVTGNRKTRDPICNGFAFLDVESEEAADRFVQKYSKQNVLFGKVQKQITCVVINPRHSSSCPDQLIDDTETFAQSKFTDLGDEMPEKSDRTDLSQDSQEKIFSEGFSSTAVDDQTLLLNGKDVSSSQFEGMDTSIEHLDICLSNNAENNCHGDGLGSDDSPLFQEQRKQAPSRKKIVKTKSVRTSKLSMSGSMARLKVKERAVLTGVFSKYGGKVSPDLSKQS